MTSILLFIIVVVLDWFIYFIDREQNCILPDRDNRTSNAVYPTTRGTKKKHVLVEWRINDVIMYGNTTSQLNIISEKINYAKSKSPLFIPVWSADVLTCHRNRNP